MAQVARKTISFSHHSTPHGRIPDSRHPFLQGNDLRRDGDCWFWTETKVLYIPATNNNIILDTTNATTTKLYTQQANNMLSYIHINRREAQHDAVQLSRGVDAMLLPVIVVNVNKLLSGISMASSEAKSSTRSMRIDFRSTLEVGGTTSLEVDS